MRKTIVSSHLRRNQYGGATRVRKHTRRVGNNKLARKAIKYAEQKLIRAGKALTKQAVFVIAVSFLVSHYWIHPVTAKKIVCALLV